MPQRYYSERPVTGDRAELAGAEAHHLAHVLRAAPGTEVVLFDGTGAEFQCRVLSRGRAAVQLEVVSAAPVSRELALRVVLATALPKGDRARWLVEKATELGVTRVVPLRTRHTVVEPGRGVLARLRRTVVEASKQCGRNRLMEIVEPCSWSELVESHGGRAVPDAWPLVAQPGSPGRLDQWPGRAAAGQGPRQDYVLAIGPEGGLTQEEIQAAERHAWQLVDLGSRTLRIETAAIALAAWACLGGAHQRPTG